MTDQNSAITEISAATQNNVEKLKQNPQYQEMQKQLASKRVEQEKQNEKAVKPIDTQDKVEIKSLFNWQKSAEGDFEIKLENRIGVNNISNKDIKYSGDKVLRLLGYKINLSERMESLKENYMKTFIETKSSNLLLAKFAQVKFGMLNTLLSLMGITTEELQKLQKKALSTSIDENISLFEQNEYSAEMLNIFSTQKKKDKGKNKMLDEIRQQLIDQMTQFGEKDFYSEEKISTIRKEQVLKIQEDLMKEKQNIEYLRDFQ